MLANPSASTVEKFQRSVALKRKVLPPDHLDIAFGLNAIGEALHRLGRDAEALPINAEVHRMVVKTYGAEAPALCMSNANRGEYLMALGRSDEALPILTEAVACWDRQMGPDSEPGAYALTDLGLDLLSLSHPRPTEAVRHFERALRIREAQASYPGFIAETRFGLARALWDAGTDRKHAVELAGKARDEYATANDAKHAETVARWLESRAR
jgi:tetratricopeptide (TPR) repeat protein